MYDLDTFELIAEHQLDAGGFWSISFLPDGRRLVAGEITGAIRVFDAFDATTSVVFDGVKPREARTAISPDGTLMAAGGDQGAVQIWSVRTGALVASAAGHAFNVNSVEFFAEGDRLVSGSQDGTAIVWQLSAG